MGTDDGETAQPQAVQYHWNRHAHRQDEGYGAAAKEQLSWALGRPHTEGHQLSEQTLPNWCVPIL